MICVVLLLVVNGDSAPMYDGKIRQAEDGTWFAFMKPPYASNHASTIEVFPDGSLGLAWFSGKGEGLNRCSIVFATLPNGTDTWTDAITVSVHDGYSDQNPVLYYDSHSSLLRLYHSQQPANDGEKNSRILELNSTDFGKTWTTPDIFKGGDFPGAFPRNRIIDADDGGLLFPIYNANDQHSIIERSNIPRKHWDHIDIQGTHDMVRIFHRTFILQYYENFNTGTTHNDSTEGRIFACLVSRSQRGTYLCCNVS